MKKKIIAITMSWISMTVLNNVVAQSYYVLDVDIQKKVAITIAKEYSNNDPKEQKALEGMIEEAFEKYFESERKKTQALDIFEKADLEALKQNIKQLEDSIKTKNSIIKSLSKEGNAKILQDSLNIWRVRIRQMNESKDSVIVVKSDSINNFISEVSKLNDENNQLQNEIDALKQSASIVENIIEQLTERQESLNTAYQSCNQSLKNISNISEKKKAIEEYRNFLKELNQPLPREQQAYIKFIEAVCSAAEFYNHATQSLENKYDRKVVEDLLKKYQSLSYTLKILKDQQSTELTMIADALTNEDRVIKNFRNGVIYSLKEEGSIPNPEAIENVLQIINENVHLLTMDDPNRSKDGYNRLYIYINKILDELRAGIKKYGGNSFCDEKKYEDFLNKISESLGDQV